MRISFFVLSCCVLLNAHAAPVQLPDELTLADALRAAAEHHPELRGQVFALDAAEGARMQADVRPNPELGLEVENLGVSEERETTLSLSQLIELGDKRRLRLQVAGAQAAALQSEQAMRRLDIFAEVARRFIQVLVSQSELALAQRAAALDEQRLKDITARVEAARSPVAERNRATIAAARARLGTAQAERTLMTSRYQLAVLWGASTPQFSSARADLNRQPEVADFETLAARLNDNPDIARYLNEQRLRDAELQAARAARTPDVTLGAGVRRFEEGGDHALVLSFSAPLPFSNRNEGAIRSAHAELKKTETEREAAMLDARAKLFDLHQQLEQARMEARTLESEIVPQAEEALVQTEDGYWRGRFSYLEVSEAQRELIDVHRSGIETAARYHLLLVEIERLTGQALALPAP